jgi:hypothetical protein
VKIDVNKADNSIRIQGMSSSMADVVADIYKIFQEVDEEKRNQMQSDLISKEVMCSACVYTSKSGRSFINLEAYCCIIGV